MKYDHASFHKKILDIFSNPPPIVNKLPANYHLIFFRMFFWLPPSAQSRWVSIPFSCCWHTPHFVMPCQPCTSWTTAPSWPSGSSPALPSSSVSDRGFESSPSNWMSFVHFEKLFFSVVGMFILNQSNLQKHRFRMNPYDPRVARKSCLILDSFGSGYRKVFERWLSRSQIWRPSWRVEARSCWRPDGGDGSVIRTTLEIFFVALPSPCPLVSQRSPFILMSYLGNIIELHFTKMYDRRNVNIFRRGGIVWSFIHLSQSRPRCAEWLQLCMLGEMQHNSKSLVRNGQLFALIVYTWLLCPAIIASKTMSVGYSFRVSRAPWITSWKPLHFVTFLHKPVNILKFNILLFTKKGIVAFSIPLLYK